MAADEEAEKPKKKLAKVETPVAEEPTGDDESEEEDEESSDETASEDDEESNDESEESEGEGDEEAAAAGEEEAPTPEEAARANRRERRRKRKLGEDADAPKDRNKKVRAALLQKRAEAEEIAEPLTATEIVDDALARGVAKVGKWAGQNTSIVAGAVLAAIAGAAGWGLYVWRTSSQAEDASSTLAAGVDADRGHVDPDPPPMKKDETPILPTFKTEAERETAAIAGYKKVESDHKGSGAAILARLGEAGVLLDKKAWDDSLAAYREVKASPLAAADSDVMGRSIEGIGYALEGKGDKDGAAKVFKELETTGVGSFKELGMYHQARIAAAKGDKAHALEILKATREKLKASSKGPMTSASYLEGVVDDLQRQLDPASAPPKMGFGGGNPMQMQQIMQMQQQLQQMQNGEEE